MDSEVPYLSALTVSGTGSSSTIALVPPFSASINDYYVRCAAGVNALSVAMTASPGAETQLVQPTKSGLLPTQTLPVSVDEGGAIVATANKGTTEVEYWVRCLPSDFPTIRMEKHPEAGAPPPPGYYLVGNKRYLKVGAYLMVIDSNGVPVWFLRDPVPPPNSLLDVENIIPGAISFLPNEPGYPFEIHFLSPESNRYVGMPLASLDNHELRYLSTNGHYLVFDHPVTTGVDLTGLAIKFKDGGVEPLGPNSNIQNCVVVELDSTGANVVWTWTATDHFDVAQASTFPQVGVDNVTGPDGGAVVDPFHCNSIDVDPANGNLLVSSRHMDSVFYIEKSSGRVLWKMGGTTNTKDGARYVSVADAPLRQHDARLLPGWSATCGVGQVSMFDDRTQAVGPMRGVIYDVQAGPPPDGGSSDCDGGAFADGGVTDAGTSGIAKVAWQYTRPGTSSAMGSLRILDSFRVIGWGAPLASSTPAFTEVDPAGHDLLDFYLPPEVFSYRAVKIPLTAFDLSVLRATAGIP
jgi:hypothetical protein